MIHIKPFNENVKLQKELTTEQVNNFNEEKLGQFLISYGDGQGKRTYEKRREEKMKKFTDKINESVDVNKLPTANEWLETFGADADDMFYRYSVEEAMIEFAKLHVEAALKKASETVFMDKYEEFNPMCDKNSILNAYPLTNIK